jgi:mannose-6-phosphate isomerase-like protein (cupin superfamily)
MINVGQTIENQVTGERLTFIETAASTHGEHVLVECVVRPGGIVAAAHVHPHQTERFKVVEGTIGMQVGREKLLAGPGEVVVVEPGTGHRFWNDGDVEATFVCEVRPALAFESLIETMFNLAADGKTNRKGMPNPFRLAVIAKAHFDDVRLPFPPVFLQRAGLALAAPFGRALGFEASYEPAAPEGDLAPV